MEKETRDISTSTNQGALADNKTCVSVHFRLDKRLVQRTKEYAYQERLTQKEVISQALEQFLTKNNY